jgi:hypothetical protein
MTTALEVLGCICIVAGVAVILWPAGLIVAGVMLIAASWRLER